jgi:hypothetical protein
MAKLLLASGLAAGAVLAGCTAILGSFDVATSAPLPDGGGSSGVDGSPSGPPDSGAPDGSTEADAATGAALSCAIEGTPRELDTIVSDPASPTFDRVEVFRAAAAVRIVTTRRVPGAPVPEAGMITYAFDPKAPGTTTAIPSNVLGEVVDIHRQGGIGQISILAVLRPNPATVGDHGSMIVYELPDTDVKAVNEVPVSGPFANPPEPKAQFGGALGIYGNTDTFFWSLSTTKPSNNTTEILIGKRTAANATPAPVSVASGLPVVGSRYVIRDLMRSGSNVYIFNAQPPDPANPNGTEYFTVPETGVLGTAPALLPITPVGQATPFFLVAGDPTTTGLRLVVANVKGAAVDVRMGDLGAAQLSPIDATTVPEAFTFPSLLAAPLTAPFARVYGDDIVWAGTPADSEKGRGVDFAWFNLTSNSVQAMEIGLKRLLLTETGITHVAVDFAGVPNGTSGDLDLVWTQDRGNGKTSLLWANVHCAK